MISNRLKSIFGGESPKLCIKGQEVYINLIKKLFILFCLNTIVSLFGQNSEGKDFWVCPSVNGYNDSFFVIVSSNKPSKVKVRMPKKGFVDSVNLGYNDLRRIYIPNAYKPTSGDLNKINDFAIHVTASSKIFTYTLSAASATTDASFCFPTEAIPVSVEYVVPMPVAPYVAYASDYYISIICQSDSSKIDITTSEDANGFTKDVLKTITLKYGDCYILTGSKSLAGSKIKSQTGKKILVTSGNRCIALRCAACDHIYEATPPTVTMGKTYITTPFLGQNNGYDYQVLAVENNTKVFENGILVATLDKGQQFYRPVLGDSGFCVTGDKGISVVQYMIGKSCSAPIGGDPAMVVLNSFEQSIKNAVVSTSNTTLVKDHYINIVVSAAGVDSVYLDGILLPKADFKSIGCGGYYVYRGTVTPGNHQMKCNLGIICYLYGIGTYESYAYSAGANLRNLNRAIFSESFAGCDGDFVVKLRTEGDTAKNFFWWFNGDTSSKINPFFIVDAPGVYPVKLAYYNILEKLNDTIQADVVIDPPQFSDYITFDSIVVCAPNYTIELPDVNILKYEWNTGDTTASLLVTQTGNYKVTITNTVTGCILKDSCNIQIFKAIKSGFTMSMPKACPNYPLYVNDTSFLNGDVIANRQWILDNVYANNQKKDTFAIAAASDYFVKLIIKTKNGCVDSTTKKIIVNDYPTAILGIRMTDSCYKNNSVRFLNGSKTSFGLLSGYKWLYSNGDTSIQQNPTRSFKDSGLYNVRLIAYTEGGCDDTSAAKPFRIYSAPYPTASVVDSAVCIKGNYFDFKNNTPINNASYIWDWGNGTGTTVENPGKTVFFDTGEFKVKFIGMDNQTKCKDTSYRTIRVLPSPDIKILLDSFNYCLNKNFYAVSYTINNTLNGKGNAVWNWGDGTSTNNANPFVKNYLKDSNFTIRLTYSLGSGCRDTAIKKVLVYKSPIAQFAITDSNVCSKSNYFVIDNSSVAIGSARWSWVIDSLSNKNTKQIGSITFPSEGQYKINLYVRDSLTGCVDTIRKRIDVLKSPVLKMAISDSTMCQFTDSLTFEDITDYGNLSASSTWYWNSNPTPVSKLIKDKSRVPQLISTLKLVGGQAGYCIDSLVKNIKVYYDKKPVTLVKNIEYACLPAKANFSAESSTTNSWQYNWTFGALQQVGKTWNGVVSNSLVDEKIILEATDSNSCKIIVIDSFKSFAPPSIKLINNSPDTQCMRFNQFKLSTITESKTSTYDVTWLKDELLFDSTLAKNLRLNAIETSEISVFLKNNKGCIDSSKITISTIPNQNLSITSDTACLGANRFLKVSSNPILPNTNYAWYIDDAFITNGATLNYLHDKVGNKTLNIISNTDFNCLDTSNYASIITRPLPIARFNYNLLNPNSSGVRIQLRDSSSGNPIDFEWKLGSKIIGTTDKLSHLQKDLGKFLLLLTVKDEYGCTDTASNLINFTSSEYLHVPTAFSPNQNRLNETFKPAFLSPVNDYELKVFNRWGQLIFKTNNPEEGWNGEFMNSNAPDGAYIWVIYARFLTNNIYSDRGSFQLIR